MKKTISFIAGLLLALTGMAQENKGGISGFMKEELEDFDKFMDDADKDFINFMREPWKEFEAEKPVLKRVKPEPVKPVVYDEKTTPKSEKPVCLTIEEILDMTTSEGKQKPVVQLNEVDRIVFDKPEVIVRKKKDPKVIIIEEKACGQAGGAAGKETGGRGYRDRTGSRNLLLLLKQTDVRSRRADPRLPVSSTPTSPLYRGESGRSKIAYGGLAFY